MNYARRQQYRRLSHAGKAGPGSVIAALFGLVAASAGAGALAGLLLLAGGRGNHDHRPGGRVMRPPGPGPSDVRFFSGL